MQATRAGPGFPHGLMFHRFRSPGAGPGPQGALTPDQLERLLRFVGPERILSPAEWLTRLEHGTLRETDLCLTFDDGLRSQAEHALPVLERYGLQAFWFVCSCVFHGRPIRSEVYSHASARVGGMAVLSAALRERCPPDVLSRLRSPEFESYVAELRRSAPWYSREDLEYRFLRNRVLDAPRFESMMDRLLRERGIDPEGIARTLWLNEADLARLTAAGHCVGLHSWDHPYEMARLAPSVQREQYARNRDHLAAVTGKPPVAMAHPLNSYGEDTLTILRDLGIRCGFRANTVPPPSGRINGGPLELAREDAANLLAAMGDPA